MVEEAEEEANGIAGGKYFRNNYVGQTGGRKGWLCMVQSPQSGEGEVRTETIWTLCHGSSPQRRRSFPREERDRKQEASEGSTVQLGMALERNVWEQTL